MILKMQEIMEKIKLQIDNNDIILYMKGTPVNPLCGFSAQTVHILNELSIKYAYVDVLENQDIRKTLPYYSNWPTFPQLFYKGNLIGGADIVLELYENNKLKSKLTENNLTEKI
jgi:monothiol glutaredoxin